MEGGPKEDQPGEVANGQFKWPLQICLNKNLASSNIYSGNFNLPQIHPPNLIEAIMSHTDRSWARFCLFFCMGGGGYFWGLPEVCGLFFIFYFLT